MPNLHITDVPPDTDNEYTAALDRARSVAIASELRALELVQALKAAIVGAPHWRLQATRLLGEIAEGVVAEPSTTITGYHYE